MNTLLWEMAGWLGYLQRPPVVLQVLLIVLLVASWRQLRRQPRIARWHQTVRLIAPPLLVLLLARLLGAVGWSAGLVGMLGLTWLGWSGLSLLCLGLERFIPKAHVSDLENRLLRPLYLVAIVLMMINHLNSLADLAVIPLFTGFGMELSVGTVLTSVLASYLLLIGSKQPAAALAWLMQKLTRCSEGSRKAMALLIRYSMVGLGITAVGFHVGLNGNALLAITGGLSVGLGFGVKEVFSNFISGLWLLFEGSVRPGEVLIVDGDPCEVRRLGLRATLLWRNRDNAELLVPNHTFFTTTATTFTATDRRRRSEIRIGAAYRHDPQKVLRLLEETALSVPRVLHDPAPKALQLAYGESAIEYSLRYWINDPMTNIGIISTVNQAIWEAFQRENIEIPYPQRVNHTVPSSHREETGPT